MQGEIAGRQKFWNELNDKEKIERMREQVRIHLSVQDGLLSKMSLLEKHSHSLNGEINIPYKNQQIDCTLTGLSKMGDPEKSYF